MIVVTPLHPSMSYPERRAHWQDDGSSSLVIVVMYSVVLTRCVARKCKKMKGNERHTLYNVLEYKLHIPCVNAVTKADACANGPLLPNICMYVLIGRDVHWMC